MIRSTTNGTLASYRYNLQRSTYTLNASRNTVLTQRKFNSFAEDPAAAARSFQLRRSFLRTESQYEVGQSVTNKFDMAWNTLQSVVDDVNNRMSDSAFAAIITGSSDTSGSGRNALGQALVQQAEGIVLTMNARYGDNYIFSGSDGLNIPFTWQDGELFYRGISVDTAVPGLVTDGDQPVMYTEAGAITTDPALAAYYKAVGVDKISVDEYNQLNKDLAALDYMSSKEAKYADLGLGLEEDANGNIVDSSAANVALQAINYLGYGVDEDGDPKNIVSIMRRMGELLLNCDADSGNFADGDDTEFYRLAEKFETAAAYLSDKHVALDTEISFLKSNQTQLEDLSYTLNNQIASIEDVDLAEAITAFSWAQYCYNASLQSGNSILSQSLMDYLNT